MSLRRSGHDQEPEYCSRRKDSHLFHVKCNFSTGCIGTLARLLRLGNRGRLLEANAALGRLHGLGRLGGGGSTGSRGARAGGGGLRRGLASTEHLLQTCGLIRRSTVLLLLQLSQATSLGVDVGDLLRALAVCIVGTQLA